LKKYREQEIDTYKLMTFHIHQFINIS